MEILYLSEDIEMPDINQDETTTWIKKVANNYNKYIGEISC